MATREPNDAMREARDDVMLPRLDELVDSHDHWEAFVMPYTRRASVGVDRTLTPWARLRATYSHQIGRNLFRSRDLNAPINGVRPDPTLRNITQLESTADRVANESALEIADSFDSNGFYIQSGMFLYKRNFEVAARYASFDPTDSSVLLWTRAPGTGLSFPSTPSIATATPRRSARSIGPTCRESTAFSRFA